MPKLTNIEGVGDTLAAKMRKTGITTTEALLEKGSTTQGRKELAETTGVSEKVITRFVNMSDLFRIKGVGEEYSDLLEAAGVDTVPEMAQRNAENLHDRMIQVNEEKHLVRQVPTEHTINEWVDQAKNLPRVIKY